MPRKPVGLKTEPTFKFKAVKDAVPEPPKWPSKLVLSVGILHDSPWAGIGANVDTAVNEMCEHTGADLSEFELRRVFEIEIS